MKRVLLWTTLSIFGCKSASSGSAPSGDAGRAAAAPVKLEPLEREVPDGVAPDASLDERDRIFTVVPLKVVGPTAPAQALRLELDGEAVRHDGAPFELSTLKRDQAVLLVPIGETYLAQAAVTLAAIDDVGADAWLQHPDHPIAWPMDLRDEGAFQTWIDDPEPGKVRIIQRADGFELQTNLGKLPGQDPNGPTVPVRGGMMDLKTLQKGLDRVSARFKTKDVCFVPSFGTELNQVARAVAANWKEKNVAFFPVNCLIYPRPRSGDGGR